MARRREPERTCVGCRGKAPRRELLRIVAGPAGGMAADPAARAAGRGAYVHRDPACVEAALKHGALARALKASPRQEEVARLRDDIEREVRR